MPMAMRLSDICITRRLSSSIPCKKELDSCMEYWNEHHKQDRYIIINDDFVLIDGYIMYLVLKKNHVEYADVEILSVRVD